MAVQITDEMVERAMRVFHLRTHEQSRFPGKWDRAAAREILEAALNPVNGAD